jgi:ribonuclease HI
MNSADWNSYQYHAKITKEMVEKHPIDESVRLITNTIISAAEASIPKTSGRPRRQMKPWWNENCKQTYKEKRRAFGIFKRYPTTENFTNYKKCKAIFRRTLRRSQADSWRTYINTITSKTTSKQLWNKVKRSSGIYPNNQISILKSGNTIISSTTEIANKLATTLADTCSNNSYPPYFKNIKIRTEKKPINFRTKGNLSYNDNFTLFELNKAIKNTHKTSPGPDKISYTMLKNLSDASFNNLLLLYNRIWQENAFPSSWRQATIIPILKPGKDPTDPLNYRPIALTNCLCKLLEKMVNSRLMYYLEKNNCISNIQSGFRRGRCTLDNMVDLESKIRNAFVKRNHLVSIFFDIEKAYDRTWRYGILKQLYNYDLRGNLPIFIQNFLALRKFKVRIGSCFSDDFIQEQGVPQGSVLSVTLFIIAINNILNEIPPSVTGNLYVDDLHISCEGADMRFIERQLQTAVNRIVKWTEHNGFTLSTSKTNLVHFCRKRGVHPDPSIYFAGNNIKIVNEIKFLGVIFDNKLTFRPHVLYLRKKCERSLNLLKVLSNTNWGAERTSLMKIYHAVIRSKLDYGCVVYGSARTSILQKLNTVHHLALRLCSGAFRTSPVESLYVDCCEAPLYVRRKVLSLQYYFRISSNIRHPLHNRSLNSYLSRLYHARHYSIPPFHQRAENILSEIDFDNADILADDVLNPPWHIPSFNFLHPFNKYDKVSTADIVYQQLFNAHRQSYSSHIPVFTDGSKAGKYVGCAYIIRDKYYNYKLHPSFTIFTAEILAILKALEQISLYHKDNYIFYTDSLSVLESLSNPNQRSHPLIIKTLALFDKLSLMGFSIEFCWIPSHVGIAGNERADKAAKCATNTLNYAIPYCDAKKYINNLIYEKWQRNWDKQLQVKLHEVKPVIKYWPPLTSRKLDVILTRLRIGHCRFTHVHLLLGESAPICQLCKVIMTVKHILIECPNFYRHRLHHFQNHNVSMTDLLGNIPHKNIFNFLKHIHFYPHI